MIYGESFFHSDSLKYLTKKYLAYLPEDIKILVSRGSSGCAIASAMLVKSQKNLSNYYVKKDAEDHHGTNDLPYANHYAIVDDFVYHGHTLRIIVRDLQNKCAGKLVKITIIVCYGLFDHIIEGLREKYPNIKFDTINLDEKDGV